MDYVTYKFDNGTSAWSYVSLPWTLGGYSSKIEEYIGDITIQGLEHIYSPEVTPKRIENLAYWLIRNVFSVAGIA